MTCTWIEGFETHLNTAQLARKYATQSGSVQVKTGRVHGNASAPISWVVTTPSAGTDNTFVLGFGLKFVSHRVNINTGNQGFHIETGTSEQCHLEMESTTSLGVRFHFKRGATILATSAYQDFNVWMYVELKVTVRDGVNGAYELRINGASEFSASGVNCANNATDGWDVFAMRFSSNYSSYIHLDDIYVFNGSGANNIDFAGPSIVEGLLPNADGATVAWTQNGSGAHYTSVDDPGTSAPDDSGVGGTVGSDTNTQKDLFAFEDLTQITGTIHAVQLGTQMAMAASGSRVVKTKYRDPSTSEADGDSHTVNSTTFDEFTETFDLNPQSAAAWDVADIDDGQFGVEVVS